MYDFNQAVRINFKHKGKPQSQNFIRGRHHVSQEVMDSEDFAHFVNCGWIAEVDTKNVPAPQENFVERSQRLAKKLAEKHLPAEPVDKDEDIGVEESPQQKAARTRALNKAKAEKGD
jgi:hypothetical protein